MAVALAPQTMHVQSSSTSPFQYQVVGQDPDGNTVTYGLNAALPSFGSLSGNTFSFSPGYSQAT